MKSENKIWIELLYLLLGLVLASALIMWMPERNKSHPTMIAVPCDCMSS